MDTQIKNTIEQALKPTHLEVINESHKHKGHAGDDGSGESHFKLIIVSKSFEGQGRLARSRLVHTALADVLAHKIHALSLRSFTPDEYKLQ